MKANELFNVFADARTRILNAITEYISEQPNKQVEITDFADYDENGWPYDVPYMLAKFENGRIIIETKDHMYPWDLEDWHMEDLLKLIIALNSTEE